MKLMILFTLLLPVVLPVFAQEADDRACQVIDEADSIDQEVAGMVMEQAENIGDVVLYLSDNEKHRVKRAIRYSLVQYPGEVNDIVTQSLQDGATTEDVAVQCDCSLPHSVIPDLVGSAISAGAGAHTMSPLCIARMQRSTASIRISWKKCCSLPWRYTSSWESTAGTTWSNN